MLQLRGVSAPSRRRVPYALVLVLLALTALVSIITAIVLALIGRRVPGWLATLTCVAVGTFLGLLGPFRDSIDPRDGGDA